MFSWFAQVCGVGARFVEKRGAGSPGCDVLCGKQSAAERELLKEPGWPMFFVYPVPELPAAQGWDQQKGGLASRRGSKSCSEALRSDKAGVEAYDGSLPPKAHFFSSFFMGLRSESFAADQLRFKKEYMVLTSMGAVPPPGCSYGSGGLL